MMVKKVFKIIGLLIILAIILAGCETKLNYNSLVAASGLDCQISVYGDNFRVIKNDANLDFSDWQNIKSVSADVSFLGGIKKDGSVVVTCYPMLELNSVSCSILM